MDARSKKHLIMKRLKLRHLHRKIYHINLRLHKCNLYNKILNIMDN